MMLRVSIIGVWLRGWRTTKRSLELLASEIKISISEHKKIPPWSRRDFFCYKEGLLRTFMFILLYVVSFLPSSISFCLTYVTFLQVREPDIFQQLVVCGGLSFFNLYSNIMLYTCISIHCPPHTQKKTLISVTKMWLYFDIVFFTHICTINNRNISRQKKHKEDKYQNLLPNLKFLYAFDGYTTKL